MANCGRKQRTEEPGMLQPMGLQRVGHDLVTEQQQNSVVTRLLTIPRSQTMNLFPLSTKTYNHLHKAFMAHTCKLVHTHKHMHTP